MISRVTKIRFRPLLRGVLFLIAMIGLLAALPLSGQHPQASSDVRRPTGHPPSHHMRPPGKQEPTSPGPRHQPEAAISQQAAVNGNPVCSNAAPAYSKGDWQYAIFQLCASVVEPRKIRITIKVTEAQYYWGAWYYNKYPISLVNGLVYLGVPGTENPLPWSIPKMDGSGKAYDFVVDTGQLSVCSGSYEVNLVAGTLQGMYYSTSEWAVPLPQMKVTLGDTDSGSQSLREIQGALGNDRVLAYQFRAYPNSRGFQVPMQTDNGELCSLRQPGTLLVVQKAVGNTLSQLVPYMLGDTHTGPAIRCEKNPDAKVGTTEEFAELYMPVQAWGRLGGPDFAININYFDVRDQLNGNTWKETQCSTPLGVYYDNDPSGPTGGTHNQPEKYLAGPAYFVDKENNRAPVDTFFWLHGIAGKPSANQFSMVRTTQEDAKNVIETAAALERKGGIFTAFSGTALIPFHQSDIAPDSGGQKTTRIGIGYNRESDQLYVFEGGTYRDGVDREELAAIFRALNAAPAMEIDGGGSAALIIKNGSAKWGGDEKPPSSCTNSGAWCSPVTQQDGTARPVPSWLGLNLTPMNRPRSEPSRDDKTPSTGP